MKISIVQHDIIDSDKTATLLRLERLLLQAEPSDLYVLPEMFSSGFVMNAPAVAEPAGGETAVWMEKMATRLNAAVAGSVATADGGAFFNRFHFVEPGGKVTHYDKRHLFGYGGESTHYSPGGNRVTVEYRGVRLLLQVCYDLRFPVWSRNRGDYDAAIYVASWPQSRIAVWDLLLQARAVENQCFVVGVNRIGSDESGIYPGHSVVLDYYGRRIASCEPGNEQVVTAELDLPKLAGFRQKFPVLDDADRFPIV